MASINEMNESNTKYRKLNENQYGSAISVAENIS